MSLLLKECRWCGVSFVPTHFNDAYCCDGCRLEKRREDDRLKAKAFRPKSTVRPVREGVPTIDDVVSSVMKHKEKTGRLISYGKMVAIMERGGV